MKNEAGVCWTCLILNLLAAFYKENKVWTKSTVFILCPALMNRPGDKFPPVVERRARSRVKTYNGLLISKQTDQTSSNTSSSVSISPKDNMALLQHELKQDWADCVARVCRKWTDVHGRLHPDVDDTWTGLAASLSSFRLNRWGLFHTWKSKSLHLSRSQTLTTDHAGFWVPAAFVSHSQQADTSGVRGFSEKSWLLAPHPTPTPPSELARTDSFEDPLVIRTHLCLFKPPKMPQKGLRRICIQTSPVRAHVGAWVELLLLFTEGYQGWKAAGTALQKVRNNKKKEETKEKTDSPAATQWDQNTGAAQMEWRKCSRSRACKP